MQSRIDACKPNAVSDRNKVSTESKQIEAQKGGSEAQKGGSTRTIVASLAALGSIILASTCCLPMFPFLLAAGAAGSSAFFTRIRPYLLLASALFVVLGFYQRWRAKQCNCRPNPFSAILLWFSAVVVVVSILFPQAIANLIANMLAR